MKKKLRLILILLAAAGAILAGYLYYLFVYRTTHQPKPKEEIIATNTDAAVYQLEELIKKLEEYDEWFDAVEVSQMEDEREYGTYIIPGLKTTKTIQTSNFKLASCTSMTPQGLAVTEDYLFISAYCHTHDHNSVIYMLDKETHQFIKEIVLPDQSHAGGLAYDTENNMLWVSGEENGTAYANAYLLQNILDYNVDLTKMPLFYMQRAPLYTLKRNSFMTYNDNHLYAGYFNKKQNGTLQKYELENNGTLKTQYNEEGVKQRNFTIQGKQVLPSELSLVSPKVQGIAFEEEYLLLSQSYGAMKSVLRVFDRDSIDGEGYQFTDENALISFELPDKLEQIYVFDHKVYLLFESAAYAYRARPLTNVDRVISVSLKEEIAKAEQDKENETLDISQEDDQTIDDYFDENETDEGGEEQQ